MICKILGMAGVAGRLAQRRRDYNRLVQGYERQRERGLDDLVELTQPTTPRFTVRPIIEGINYPAPGETWEELQTFRAAYGLPAVKR